MGVPGEGIVGTGGGTEGKPSGRKINEKRTGGKAGKQRSYLGDAVVNLRTREGGKLEAEKRKRATKVETEVVHVKRGQ